MQIGSSIVLFIERLCFPHRTRRGHAAALQRVADEIAEHFYGFHRRMDTFLLGLVVFPLDGLRAVG